MSERKQHSSYFSQHKHEALQDVEMLHVAISAVVCAHMSLSELVCGQLLFKAHEFRNPVIMASVLPKPQYIPQTVDSCL